MTPADRLRQRITDVVCEVIVADTPMVPVIDDRELAELHRLLSGLQRAFADELDALASMLAGLDGSVADELHLIASEYRRVGDQP